MFRLDVVVVLTVTLLSMVTAAEANPNRKTSLIDILQATAVKTERDQSTRHDLRKFPTTTTHPWVPTPPKCPPRPPVPTGGESLSPTLIDSVVQHLKSVTLSPCVDNTAPHVPSATAMSGGFVLGGKRYPVNEGCVNRSASTPQKPTGNHTIFRLGSMSKTFVAEAVRNAYHDKKIESLDDAFSDYFPEFSIRNPFDDSKPTFKQMASQIAGIPSEPPCQGLPDCLVSTETILERVKEHGELIFPPGFMPSYSNLAFGVLGNLLPQLWGGKNATYEWYLRKHITEAHQMKNTGLNFTDDIKARMAVEYAASGSVAQWTHLGFEDPSGGVYSTGDDMLTWVEHYLADWKQSGLRKQLFQPMYLNGDGKTGFGMPWEIVSSTGYLVRTKAGALSGVSTVIALIPELDFGYVFLWNGEGFDSTNIAQAVADSILPTLVASYTSRHRHYPTLNESFISAYVGNYNGGNGLNLTIEVSSDPNFDNRTVVHMFISAYGLRSLLRPYPSSSSAPKGTEFAFRFDVLRRELPCMASEISNDGNWVYFSRHPTRGTPQMFMPGVEYQVYPKW